MLTLLLAHLGTDFTGGWHIHYLAPIYADGAGGGASEAELGVCFSATLEQEQEPEIELALV